MLLIEIIFWLSLFFLFYSYLGYAILTYILISLGKKKKYVLKPGDEPQPQVTIIIAAYNEEKFIESKIENTFELNYPK